MIDVLKRIWMIFARDMKVSIRDFISLFIILFSPILAIGINLITPSINDTTVNVAVIAGEDADRADYFDQFAHVVRLASREAVEARVLQRDSVFGLVREQGETVILAQGDEPGSTVDYAKLVNVLYESGAQKDDARSRIIEFGRTIPPLKKVMVNVMLLFNVVMAGMLIALNIIEEKTDRTISAIHVSPASRLAFILGKSMLGMVSAIVLSVLGLLITGFSGINMGQAILVIFSLTLLSLMIGFIQGLNGNDVMEAAGSVKLMFLPLAGSIIGYELLDSKWHPFLYWSPFFWAYRANEMILSQSGSWLQLLLYTVIILAICGAVFAVLAPKIRKGLEAQ